jgi:hypothetical protein
VVVQLEAPNKPGDNGTVAVLPGAINAYCTGPFVLVALAIHKVVVFTGDAQPKVKFVVLVALNVGKAEIEVTVTVFTVVQPLKLFIVIKVCVPGVHPG